MKVYEASPHAKKKNSGLVSFSLVSTQLHFVIREESCSGVVLFGEQVELDLIDFRDDTLDRLSVGFYMMNWFFLFHVVPFHLRVSHMILYFWDALSSVSMLLLCSRLIGEAASRWLCYIAFAGPFAYSNGKVEIYRIIRYDCD
jgi:hypothetical protein